MVYLEIHIPVSEYIYYDRYSAIEYHNQRRCDGIKLEKNLETHSRDWCVNLIIFGVFFVKNHNAAKNYLSYKDTYNEFFCYFSEYTIGKDMDSSPNIPIARKNERISSSVPVSTCTTKNIFQKLNKIILQYSRGNTYHRQGRCRICQMKTTWMFYICHRGDPDDNHWHCNIKSFR